MYHPVLWAAFGTGITCLSTVLGSATVLFVRGKTTPTLQRMFLGFAAGVMVAASVFSLLLPAIEEAEAAGIPGWLPAAGGFVLGVLFLWGMDSLLPHLHPDSQEPEGLPSSWRRTTLLVLAVTLHNIPEGMAVGLSFALAAQHGRRKPVCRHGVGDRHWPSELSGGRRYLPPPSSGGDQHRPSLSVWRSFRSGRTYFRHFSGFGRGNHHPLYALAALLRRRHHDVCSHRGAHPGGAFGRALQYRHDERDVWLCRNDDLRHRTGIEKLIILICQRPSIYFRQMGGRLCFLG